MEGWKNGIVTGHFKENDTYSISRPDGMEDWLLFYTLDGEGYCETPSGKRSCKAGDLLLLRTGVPHSYGTRAGESWHFMWAHFRELPETRLLPADEMLICGMNAGILRRRAIHLFRALLQDSRVQGAFWEEKCSNQLSGLLLMMAEQLADQLDQRVSATIRLMSAHMKEELSIDMLAARVGLSASRLSHLFKAETGRSILDTLNRMRIEQAALLMKLAGRTASEAAYDVGFQSYNHFAQLFKKRYGVAPAQFKRGHALSRVRTE